jgi:predicted transcriptional regulator
VARLGELERAVMEVLWAAAEPLPARAVAEALPGRELAPTTVLTVLSRLESKGVVQRVRAGRAYNYAPVATREDHIAGLIREALGTAPDPGAVLARFVGTASEQEAEALRRALRRSSHRSSRGSSHRGRPG